MQSRKMSLIESVVNVFVGYAVAVIGQVLIFPVFGISVTLGQNMAIGACFTVISIARSYLIRRVFNALHSRP